MPDSSDPPVREAEEHIQATEPSELTNEEFQVRADHFFDTLLSKLERRQDDEADLDVEYAVC
jgi:frataxin